MKNTKKRCRRCHSWFTPDCRTWRRQHYCSNKACQEERKSRTIKSWWDRHKDYDKSRKPKIRAWAKCYPNYWKIWRKNHPTYVTRDNQRRISSYRRAKLSAKQIVMGKIAVEKLRIILSFLPEITAKQNLNYRRVGSLFQSLSRIHLPQNKTV